MKRDRLKMGEDARFRKIFARETSTRGSRSPLKRKVLPLNLGAAAIGMVKDNPFGA